MNGRKVDVLAVLDSVISDMQCAGASSASNMQDARAAVAELIPASAAGLSDLLAMIDAADRGEVWTVNAGTRLRVEAMAAALANVGGAK